MHEPRQHRLKVQTVDFFVQYVLYVDSSMFNPDSFVRSLRSLLFVVPFSPFDRPTLILGNRRRGNHGCCIFSLFTYFDDNVAELTHAKAGESVRRHGGQFELLFQQLGSATSAHQQNAQVKHTPEINGSLHACLFAWLLDVVVD